MSDTDPKRARDALRAAYEAALFEVTLVPEPAVIRVGAAPPPAVDAELARHDARAAAFLTAHNPRSERLPDAENALRHAALLRELDAVGVPWLPGVGRDPEGEWPPEISVLAVGLDGGQALAIARRFGQNGYVAVRRGEPARLVFTEHWGAVGRG